MKLPITIRVAFILITPLLSFCDPLRADEPRCVSGIYPHLATFNNEGECGTGAVVPWADRLWVISYGPHLPTGSSDKLYEITPDLRQIVRPESVGGTPANRMIHRESRQLIIGPYFIDEQRNVRVIAPKLMPGRHTGNARHLTDPANKVYFATMEEGLYEVDVKTLEVIGLIRDGNFKKPLPAETHPAQFNSQLPGYHGKGLYSGQGRVVYGQNGERNKLVTVDPTLTSGALAEWRGDGDWQLVRRNQFTEVTGPGGIYGNEKPASDPIWSIGWDHRSLILMVLDGGKWHAYRLPKASHTYDGSHGWHTEWPRIRDIGESDLLMTMHGMFWRFPKTFSRANSAGIVPRSTYLKIIGDFCRWNDRIVLGCDDAAKMGFPHKHKGNGNIKPAGQSQSNLWFIEPVRLDQLGPALGRGGVWINDEVKADIPSEPFLFTGFARRSLHLAHDNAEPVGFTLEVDAKGDDHWHPLRKVKVPAHGCAWIGFDTNVTGAWVRLRTSRDCAKATAFFHYSNPDPRSNEAAPIFDGLAKPGKANVTDGLLRARGDNLRTLQFAAQHGGEEVGNYELNGELKLQRSDDPKTLEFLKKAVAIPRDVLSVDAASVLLVDEKGSRWRLPKGDAAFDAPGSLNDERIEREVVTERDLFNCHGTFYEVPADSSGGLAKIRPIATHNRRIKDYASYRGLLVMSGVAADAPHDNPHIVRSDDGKCALWLGAVDDLWQFGKPRGKGGPWKDTTVKANEPSDAYLMTGYDQKRFVFSHTAKQPVDFCIEADFTGTGAWAFVRTVTVRPGKPFEGSFPSEFAAYWVRVIAASDTTATATFIYE